MKPPILHPIRRADLFLLLLILLIGALARFDKIDLASFAYDQGTNATLAQTMLATGQPAPFSSLSSFEGGAPPHPPLLIYLIALPLALGGNVFGATVLITLLNIGGIGLLWYLGYRYFSPLIGGMAALLLAVNPWAIFYSRDIWQPNITIPFTLLALVIGGLALFEGKRWAQIAFLPTLSLALQTHYAAYLTLPAFAWLAWIGRRSIDWRRMAIGLVIAVVLALPFGLGIIGWLQNRPANRVGIPISHFLFVEFNPTSLNYLVWFTTGLNMEKVIGIIRGVPTMLIWLAALIPLALGVLRLLRHYLAVGMIALLIVAVPIAITVTTNYRLFPHYFNFMQPALALIVAAGVTWVADLLLRRRILRYLTILLAITFCVSQFVWNLGLYRAMDERLIDYPRQPIRAMFELRDAALVNHDVLLFYPQSEQSSLTILRPLLVSGADCIREFAIAEGGLLLRPRGSFSAVFAPLQYLYDMSVDVSRTPYESIYQVGSAHQVSPENGYTYTIYNVPPLPVLDPVPITALGPYSFDNGVRLTGYAIVDGKVYLRWSLPKATPADYQYFIHFLNAAGDQVGQRDTSFYPGKSWCEGDELTTWIDVNVPPESATARVGMYRLMTDNHVTGDDVFDTTGARMPWIDIPLTPTR